MNKNNNTSIQQQINTALQNYEHSLVRFVKSMQFEFNIFSIRSAKNYVEEIEFFLLGLFTSSDKLNAIGRTIARTIEDKDNNKDIETKRREAIRHAYEKIKAL